MNNTNGTIGGSASVTLVANGTITTGEYLETFILNDGGEINGGDANATVSVTGDIDAGTSTVFEITNTGGFIAQNALFDLTAGNISVGESLFFEIDNQSGGMIVSDATINLNALSIGSSTVDGVVITLIANYDGGSIGGTALVNLAISGDIDVPGYVVISILNNNIFDGGGGNIGSDATMT